MNDYIMLICAYGLTGIREAIEGSVEPVIREAIEGSVEPVKGIL
ncbi:hypothetical protein [Synergistes jonesii]|nr:hypothetical protein [Synergistes jonesii]